jgi:hypothetical protein
VTLVSGTTGQALGGVGGFQVLSTNSIHGTTASDQFGSGGVQTFSSNVNFVVASPEWDIESGGTADVGAVTFASGTNGEVATGTGFLALSTNSVHGTTASDKVGSGGVSILSSGKYLIRSSLWSIESGGASNVGAVTLINEVNGEPETGGGFEVLTTNSLHGTTADDQVGTSGVIALSNGNIVVASRLVHVESGGTANVGAVTLISGTTGKTVTGSSFQVLSSNSLQGTTANDLVGSSGVTALSNGNFVVASDGWDIESAGTANVGAITLVSGTTGKTVTGDSFQVLSTNSLHGTTVNDFVGSGSVTALTNGNFVSANKFWNIESAGASSVGAVTLVSGTTGKVVSDSSFEVLSSNSLHGTTASDRFGGDGVTKLASGNFVASSSVWDNGGTTDAGVVTLVNGLTGKAAVNNSFVVSTTNSLVGTAASAGTSVLAVDSTNKTFAAQFKDNTTNRVRIGSAGNLTFAGGGNSVFTITSSFLTATLNAGTDVILQASNDITVNSAITSNNSSGDGGDLTFRAGRSVLINANITTDNGKLNVIANDVLAQGVVDGDRDAGAAVITMGSSTAIDTGTGFLFFSLDTGTGKTNLASGDISLKTLTAGSLVINNFGTSAGSDIFQTGSWTVTGTSGFNVTGDGTISLNNNVNVFTGAINVSSGTGDVDIGNSTDMILASSTFGGDFLAATAGGGITQTGALAVTGNSVFSTEGGSFNITLTNVSNSFTGKVLLDTVSGTVQLTNNTATVLSGSGGSSIGGDLTVISSGAITQFDRLAVSGTASFNAGSSNDITLDNSANNFSRVDIVNGKNVSLRDTNDIDLGFFTNSGTTLIKADKDITIKENVTSGGDFTAVADNDKNDTGKFILNSGTTVTSSTGDIDITAFRIEGEGTLATFGSGAFKIKETDPAVATAAAQQEEQLDKGTNSSFVQDFAAPARSQGPDC